MKCPLQGFEGSKWGGIEKVEAIDCLKEECAWWDDVVEQCCVLTIQRCFSNLLTTLDEICKICEEMPHAG